MSPMDASKYPPNWKEIARAVKEAAGWKCQKCGKQCYRPGEVVTRWAKVLTVAHYPDENPMNCEKGNLWALCAPCHLRADAQLHAKHRRDRRIAETGQARMEAIE